MLLGKEPSKFEVYNDIEGELVNFFRIVKNRPAELLLELDLLPLNSREEFASWLHFHDGGNEPNIHLPDQLEIIDRTTPTSLLEEAEKLKASLRKRSDYRDVRQAAAYLMRVRNSYSSSGRSFACQPFSVRTLFTQILEMSRRLENVIIEQQSFEVLIPHYDREDSFFYGDPPYYDSEYVYDAEFGWDHHVLLRDTLAKCKGKWLVSQVDCKEIRYLFRDYQILDFKRIHPMAQKYAPGKQFGELLIGNYDLLEREREVPLQMSLNELLGESIPVEQILKERIIPCKKRTMNSKTSSTGRSCYASKFALSERLVCGECGTLYRRCTWKRNGKTRIVWRCVSRLDYGTKYCHQSPTMDEEPLEQTIMAAINSVMDSKGIICSQITEAAVEETGILPNSTMTLGEINRRREELEAEFNILLQQPDSAAKNAVRFGSIANEMASLKEQREKIAARLRKDQTVQLHVHSMEAALDGMSHHMQQWDEEMIRQLVHTVKVISVDHIKVFLYDGTEIGQTVSP